jgi:hypothetical protein
VAAGETAIVLAAPEHRWRIEDRLAANCDVEAALHAEVTGLTPPA